jgi:hypothetical protein
MYDESVVPGWDWAGDVRRERGSQVLGGTTLSGPVSGMPGQWYCPPQGRRVVLRPPRKGWVAAQGRAGWCWNHSGAVVLGAGPPRMAGLGAAAQDRAGGAVRLQGAECCFRSRRERCRASRSRRERGGASAPGASGVFGPVAGTGWWLFARSGLNGWCCPAQGRGPFCPPRVRWGSTSRRGSGGWCVPPRVRRGRASHRGSGGVLRPVEALRGWCAPPKAAEVVRSVLRWNGGGAPRFEVERGWCAARGDERVGRPRWRRVGPGQRSLAGRVGRGGEVSPRPGSGAGRWVRSAAKVSGVGRRAPARRDDGRW